VFGEMARCIKQMNFEQLAMCMTMLKISGNKLSISSAGMPPLLLYKNNTNILEEHLIKGMPLGTMVKFPYEVKEIELSKGDTVLIMSDGFPEMQNPAGEIFGYQRVQESFALAASNEPEEIIEHLKNVESKWTDSFAPDDDITFVVIKVK
jgi:sigma-B regulation protein RsbU (phosphoserine phosphatase)